jgi:uncharacterized protein YecE (DUF72 family)
MRGFGQIRIRISGWNYAGWRGGFYPPRLPQKQELSYASRRFSTIEINGTFYSLQKPTYFQRWVDQTPDDFVFAVKGSRFITHMLKLRNAREALANFFASGLLCLGRKMGPLLWQFPPNFRFDAAKLEDFFSMIPRDTFSAAALAAEHTPKLNGRAFVEPIENLPLRHAMEIRHTCFESPEFIDLLRKHGIALVCADTVEWPLLMDVTADFVYCRLHGSEQLYASGYDADAIELWAQRVVSWATGEEVFDGKRAHASPACKRRARDVYVYFDNDAKVRAPFDAQALERRVGEILGKARSSTAAEK